MTAIEAAEDLDGRPDPNEGRLRGKDLAGFVAEAVNFVLLEGENGGVGQLGNSSHRHQHVDDVFSHFKQAYIVGTHPFIGLPIQPLALLHETAHWHFLKLKGIFISLGDNHLVAEPSVLGGVDDAAWGQVSLLELAPVQD